MPEVVDLAAPGVEPVEALVGGDPQAAGAVLRDPLDPVVRQAAGIFGIVRVARERLTSRVVDRQAAAEGADPEPAVRRGEQRAHVVAAQRARIVGIELEDLELVGVITDQAGLGADPEKTLAVLGERGDQMSGNLVGNRHLLKRDQIA